MTFNKKLFFIYFSSVFKNQSIGVNIFKKSIPVDILNGFIGVPVVILGVIMLNKKNKILSNNSTNNKNRIIL